MGGIDGAAVRGSTGRVTGGTADYMRLIKTDEHSTNWMHRQQILDLVKSGKNFMDITFTGEAPPKDREVALLEVPTNVTQKEVVDPIIALSSTDMIKSTVESLSKFHNRYYMSEFGKQSGEWLFGKVKEVAEANKGKLNVTVTQFKHDWGQNSVIARIEGENDQLVILGAHQDSINGMDPEEGRAPGADDDASGSATQLEAFRVLLASGYQPLSTIEFQWYSGEEGGLLGSQAIAKSYKNANKTVIGMLQLDMTSYPNPRSPDVGILTDYTDSALTKLLRNVVRAYTKLPTKDFRCGYGCSDHPSWTKYGFPSVLPAESSNMRENTKIHTPADDLDRVNYKHALNYVAIVVGYTVELSHK
jgi:leucyl aminopeptidase